VFGGSFTTVPVYELRIAIRTNYLTI